MNYLSLTIPGGQNIQPPSDIPSGGLNVVAKVFRNSYSIMIIIVIVLALIFIVLGGIQWITSEGDKTKLDAARKKLTWSIIGLLVAFSAFFIVSLLGYFFNVNLFNFS
jgi:hypothetical protein